MDTTRASLDGKVAIVTGAGRGLGRGIAEGLAAFGAKVVIAERKEDAAREVEQAVRARGHEARAVIAERREDAAREVEQAIRARGGIALAAVCDVRDGAQVDRLVERAASELGSVDILVNNVGGIYLGRDRPPSLPFLDMTETDWDDSYALNLKTVFLCTSAAGKAMVQQGRGGSIINIASSEALRAAPGFAPYAAYKAAIVNFTRTMALELAPHKVRVNCIAPDAVPSEGLAKRFPELASDDAYRHHIPLARAGTADEVASVAVFLASDLSSFVTGVTIPVEGGMLAAGGWLHHPTLGWTTDPRAFKETS